MKQLKQKLLLILSTCVMANTYAVDGTSKFNPTQEQITEKLGWVADNKMVCTGYYEDPLAAYSGMVLPDITKTPVDINANQGSFHISGTSTLEGNPVTLTQPGRSLSARKIKLNRDANTGQVTTVDLQNDVTLREPNKAIVGQSAHVELNKRAGNFLDALYRFLIGSANPATNTNTAIPLNAWGKADRLELTESGLVQISETTYSTCAPTATTWKISAKQIDLDREEGKGVARDTWVYIGGVPILYSPYLSFPIDNRRKTGFLFPTISNSTLSGFSIAFPFYWNMATNYDAVITPTLFTKRGMQLNGLFRYLTETGVGEIKGGFIPDDRAFRNFQNNSPLTYFDSKPAALNRLNSFSDNRGLISWQDTHQLTPRWNSVINYNYVTDDYYLQDFGGLSLLAQNQLPQQAAVNYLGDNWNFTTKLSSFETLHPINQSVTANAYQSFPEINLNGHYPDQAWGLSYSFINQIIYFRREKNPGEVAAPPDATRLNIQPSISLPLRSTAAYLTPTVQLSARSYQIGNLTPGFNNSVQPTIPMLSLDSGLYFDRHLQWHDASYQQTLEPRLFYLYVPFKNQNNIPVFDSALIPFSYDSLFLTNRFSGYDRIGDANQIALALTTRFLDEASGAEKFRASIGEIYYFRNRDVQLCGPFDINSAAPGSTCVNPNSLAGITSPTEKTSPIAGQLRYSFTKNWNASGNIAWDPNVNATVSGNLNLQYKPANNRVFNITYSFLRFGDLISNTVTSVSPMSAQNDLNQGGFSFGWPIGEHWAMVGAWNYNFGRSYTQSYLYGLQYDSCCWSARLVAGKMFYSLNQNGSPNFNNAVVLQWQLKGLGTVGWGGDPSTLFTNSIPGYQDNFKAKLS